LVIGQRAPDSFEDRQRGPGFDQHGFHATRTIDYYLIMEGGPVILNLDEESVELHAGDIVVQQATQHSWRHVGPKPTRILVVLSRIDGD
jgi:quercetin dioxygenase-like cupin family protein